jgi:hypothetical protein
MLKKTEQVVIKQQLLCDNCGVVLEKIGTKINIINNTKVNIYIYKCNQCFSVIESNLQDAIQYRSIDLDKKDEELKDQGSRLL